MVTHHLLKQDRILQSITPCLVYNKHSIVLMQSPVLIGLDFNKRNLFFQFWSLRSRCLQGWFLLKALSLAYRLSCSYSVFSWPFLCGVSFSSYKDPSPIRLGPHPMTSFTIDYLLKVLISKYSHTGS